MADPILVDEADKKVKQKLSMPYTDGPPLAAFNVGTRKVTPKDPGLKLQPTDSLPELTPRPAPRNDLSLAKSITPITTPKFQPNFSGAVTGTQSSDLATRVAGYKNAAAGQRYNNELRAAKLAGFDSPEERQRALQLRADRGLANQSFATQQRADMAREDALQRAFIGDTTQAKLKLAEADSLQERATKTLELVNQRETARREGDNQLKLGKQTDEATAQRQQADLQLKQQQFDSQIAFNERTQDKQIQANLELAKIRRDSQSQISPQQQKQVQEFVAKNIFLPDKDEAAAQANLERIGTVTPQEEIILQKRASKISVGSMVAQALGNINNAQQIKDITDEIIANPDMRMIFELGDLQEQRDLILGLQQAQAEQTSKGTK